jgi:hypothetical protein
LEVGSADSASLPFRRHKVNEDFFLSTNKLAENCLARPLEKIATLLAKEQLYSEFNGPKRGRAAGYRRATPATNLSPCKTR